MFQNDQPINSIDQDKLNRKNFCTNLADTITNWNGVESVVIAITGKWGSGKSSIINLIKKQFAETEQSPTVIEFNPWLFSGDEKLNEHFFDEISKGLNLRNSPESDKQIANKFRLYSKRLSLIPYDTESQSLVQKLLLILTLGGVTTNAFFSKYIHQHNLVYAISNVVIVVLLILSVTFSKIAEYFDTKSSTKTKSILALKEELKKQLRLRKKKILIIIDDIDRLTSDEIKQLFKLIKINTDFPNILYLVSFDREVVQYALNSPNGINGQDYLEKIVQVNFDVPLVRKDKLSSIFIKNCESILDNIPDTSKYLIDQSKWQRICNSGLTDLFTSIREMKRFLNSLEFNLVLVTKNNSLEVNPIDFIGIESIRQFTPDFYHFVKINKRLLISNFDELSRFDGERKEMIITEINKIPINRRGAVKGVIGILFPQIFRILHGEHLLYGVQYNPSTALKNLSICAPACFDSYFTYLPGGDDTETTQFEINEFLRILPYKQEFERLFSDYLSQGRAHLILQRSALFIDDNTKVNYGHIEIIVQNLIDSFDFSPNYNNDNSVRLESHIKNFIIELLRTYQDESQSFDTVKNCLSRSSSLYGCTYMLESLDKKLYNSEQIEDLRSIYLKKISERGGSLIVDKNFGFIFFRWYKWDNTESWKKYYQNAIKSDVGLILFLKAFLLTLKTTSGEGTSIERHFDYKLLEKFIPSNVVKEQLELIKIEDYNSYLTNKEYIDIFLNEFGVDHFAYTRIE